jgi:2-succinyl-5-enolpyruvyl-6-hydroxy-3-cyclohexene-1-carboxylate synthase
MSATDTYLLLRALCDELARCGVRHACTSPGSRNTPIVLSLARERRIRCHSHIDERCAGFFALGLARATGSPVAVTCTSGTAAANLMPAVIEAHEARVGLILLTADRPPELRDVGAGQTIDQLKLYGDAVKWFFELDLPRATPQSLRFVRSLACRACFAAVDGRAGPVHINVPLREPLVLEHPLPDHEPGGGGRADGAPWVSVARPAGQTLVRPVSCGPGAELGAYGQAPERADQLRPSSPRTVIVAGALDPGAGSRYGRELARLAASARIPLLADPLSGARTGEAAVAHYDLLLRDADSAAALAPEAVWRFGELPTSKPLRAWLSGLSCPQHAFARDEAWIDPDSGVSSRTIAPPGELIALARGSLTAGQPGWLERWRAADSAVSGAIQTVLDGAGRAPERPLSEPLVARTLADRLPGAATLLVASSMPVRDLETFAPARADPPRVLANRGANGIDGTVSSAFGVAAAAQGPVCLLIGDVALAHDLGGLLAARRLGLALTIVVVHNDGGGIFHFLPVSGEGEEFERHIATPHGLDFAHAAALYGLRHTRAATVGELSDELERSLAGDRGTIIEVRTDRTINRCEHAIIEGRALAALGGHEGR